MNRKLKKYAEKQSTQFRNEDFLEELKVRQREEKNWHGFLNKRVVSLSVSLSIAIITLTVALLCVLFNKPTTQNMDGKPQVSLQIDPVNDEPPNEIVQPKEYLSDNRISVDSDLNEMNGDLNDFSFVAGEDIKKYIDKEYNEILYYYFNYTSDDELSSIEFKICVNPDYKMVGADKEYDNEGTVASQEIQYSETVKCEDDIYFFTESGKIMTDQEIILIDAEIIGLEENSNFIEILNEIIQAK